MKSKLTYSPDAPENQIIVNSDQYGHPLSRAVNTSRTAGQYQHVIIFAAADKYGHICSESGIGSQPHDKMPEASMLVSLGA